MAVRDPSIRSTAVFLLAQIVEAIGRSLHRTSTLALEIVDISSIEEAS